MITDLAGKVFGRLTILHRSTQKHKGTSRAVRWECQCSCGQFKIIPAPSLVTYGVKSCGCIAKEINGSREKTHGLSGTRSYHAWEAMKQRCNNPKHPRFSDWGGRGITVSESWNSFEAFHQDMGNPPSGHSIDRIDNEAGYSKENCRWATPLEQIRNQRKKKGSVADPI